MDMTLNLATQRMLQLIRDMLASPDYDRLAQEREQAKAKGERVYDLPSRYRCDLSAVEAAYRMATEAQQLLASMVPEEIEREEIKREKPVMLLGVDDNTPPRSDVQP